MNKRLIFGQGNAKLSLAIGTFSLPAGFSCPFAKECKSQANRLTGKITDGKDCVFRCFAASSECRNPSVRKSRWDNFEILTKAKTIEESTAIIQSSLPYNDIVRVHVSGDFFSEQYFLSWVNVATNTPKKTFYGYTKALPFLVKHKASIPSNFRFTASRGGTHDHLINEHGLVSAEVVYSVKEAEDKGLEIDHDDSHAIKCEKSFCLLIHGTQPAGTSASIALSKLRKVGLGGYNKKTRVISPLTTANV